MKKVKDFVLKNNYEVNDFVEGQEVIISTRDYIYFNGSYHHSILEYNVLKHFTDSKGRLHLIC